MSQNSPEDISHLRRQYSDEGLEMDNLNVDPYLQFREWFEAARACELLVEPNAMTLATLGEGNRIRQRTVLLKALDEEGYVFFTNYGSQKAADMAERPQVSALFPWLPMERQVAIEGVAEKISRAESVRYFLSRPTGSQLGAWVSDQSQVISSRSLLLNKLDELKRKFTDGSIPCPEFWGGYRIRPNRYEFWQGGRDRLHDRFEYLRDGSSPWTIRRLSP